MEDDLKSWVFFAENDIISAKELLYNPRLTGEVAFHCQQAIEKYFKAYLLKYNKQIPKIHDLLKLYGEVKKIQDWGLEEEMLITIRNLYTESCYPGDELVKPEGSLPTEEEAKSYLEFAERVESAFKSFNHASSRNSPMAKSTPTQQATQ
ncbi:MAG: HEPN domain-containing protein [Fibromonadales bacterium]|nr:HEPN domain-containing protein [Fibromonadales bacterium]